MAFYWLLVLHLVGDYLLQSDWMAQRKTQSSIPAAAHALVYTAPFWLLMPSWWAMLLIGGTHFAIDRWRLARYVCWAKNRLGPHETLGEPMSRSELRDGVLYRVEPATHDGVVPHGADRYREVMRWAHPWVECAGTGYHHSRPAWLAVWLLIIADNTLHLAFNGLAWVLFAPGG